MPFFFVTEMTSLLLLKVYFISSTDVFFLMQTRPKKAGCNEQISTVPNTITTTRRFVSFVYSNDTRNDGNNLSFP